jgi:hypothetical protein
MDKKTRELKAIFESMEKSQVVLTIPKRVSVTQENFEAESAAQDAWLARMKEAKELVAVHVSFAKDGGVSRESCWDNLQDTLVDMGRLDLFGEVECAFRDAWPPLE